MILAESDVYVLSLCGEREDAKTRGPRPEEEWRRSWQNVNYYPRRHESSADPWLSLPFISW